MSSFRFSRKVRPVKSWITEPYVELDMRAADAYTVDVDIPYLSNRFLLGQLSLEACRAVCWQAGVAPETVDLVGSHGQTLWHIPVAETYGGRQVRGTLQLGEPSLICEKFGCPVVSDFRVRDMAAGGQGAPLVPYVEYLLYRKDGQTVGLQNIGGIGNLTVLPRQHGDGSNRRARHPGQTALR